MSIIPPSLQSLPPQNALGQPGFQQSPNVSLAAPWLNETAQPNQAPLQPTKFDQYVLKDIQQLQLPEASIPLTRLANQLMRANGISTPFRVVIVNQKYYNAMALPSGTILMHLETLEKAKSPDELAYLMAHELSHVNGKDSNRRIKRLLVSNLLAFSLPTSLLIIPKSRSFLIRQAQSAKLWAVVPLIVLGSTLVGVPISQMFAKMERESEYRADLNAVKMLSKAGLPVGNFREYTQALEQAYQTLPTWSRLILTIFGNDHPSAVRREVRMAQFIQSMPPQQQATHQPVTALEWSALKQAVAQKRLEVGPAKK